MSLGRDDGPQMHAPMGAGPSVWSGVYSRFDEVTGQAPIFEGTRWLAAQERNARSMLEALDGGHVEGGQDASLAELAATLSLPLQVIDFGGGLASIYGDLRPRLVGAGAFALTVIEGQAICRLGRALFAGRPEVDFVEGWSAVPPRADIVYCKSALHYVEDWRSALREMTARRPAYIVLLDLLAGDVPTFVTAQTYYGARVPVWVWSREAICEALHGLGYTLRSVARRVSMIRGRAGPLPMHALPPTHRLAHTLDLVFGPIDGVCHV